MENNKEISIVENINKEINTQLSNEAVSRALIATTFKGFSPVLMKQALLEGRIRGFTFQDFLQKDVYAIPYGQSYSLVTSIDYTRKIAMRSGLVGKSAPTYEVRTKEDGSEEIISCSVTVKRKVDGHVGDYTSTVFFKEYSSGKNLWISKPRTMLAKVAEMHALRAAFPEEMAKQYIEEEFDKEKPTREDAGLKVDGPATPPAVHSHVVVKDKKAKKEEVDISVEKIEDLHHNEHDDGSVDHVPDLEG